MDLSKKVIVVVCLVIAVLCGGIIAATLFSEPESIDEVNITNNNTTKSEKDVAESSDEFKTEKIIPDTVQFVEKPFQPVKLMMSTLREKYVTAVQTTLPEDLIMPIRN